jgi:hypothetical protein
MKKNRESNDLDTVKKFKLTFAAEPTFLYLQKMKYVLLLQFY